MHKFTLHFVIKNSNPWFNYHACNFWSFPNPRHTITSFNVLKLLFITCQWNAKHLIDFYWPLNMNDMITQKFFPRIIYWRTNISKIHMLGCRHREKMTRSIKRAIISLYITHLFAKHQQTKHLSHGIICIFISIITTIIEAKFRSYSMINITNNLENFYNWIAFIDTNAWLDSQYMINMISFWG